MAPTRSVLTVALGAPRYVEMAASLARSFLLWNDTSTIGFALATDRPELVPSDVREHIRLVPVDGRAFGGDFSVKLHLDQLAPAPSTLFIDADSLCVGPLDRVFDLCAGQAVTTVGHRCADGEWFGDVAARCRDFGVHSLTRFIGGLYYLERGARCSQVYATARDIEGRYDALGFPRMAGHPGDEPCVSIAMAIHGMQPVEDDGSVKAEPTHYPTGIAVDVFAGRAVLHNDPRHLLYNPRWPLTRAEPVLVHFNRPWNRRHPYTTEVARLHKVMAEGWSRLAANTYAGVRYAAPAIAVRSVKDALRPAYRAMMTRATAG